MTEYDVREKARELAGSIFLAPYNMEAFAKVTDRLESALTSARNAGLEEAAKKVDDVAGFLEALDGVQWTAVTDLARDIRALKTNKG